jgi:hypothetical protein
MTELDKAREAPGYSLAWTAGALTPMALTQFEIQWIEAKLSAECLVYMSHKATGGLSADEEARLAKLEALAAKITTATAPGDERREPTDHISGDVL